MSVSSDSSVKAIFGSPKTPGRETMDNSVSSQITLLLSKKCFECQTSNDVTAQTTSFLCSSCNAENCARCEKVHTKGCVDEDVQESDVDPSNVSKLRSGLDFKTQRESMRKRLVKRSRSVEPQSTSASVEASKGPGSDEDNQIPVKRIKLDALFYCTPDGDFICRICPYEHKQLSAIAQHLKTIKHKRNILIFNQTKKYVK